MTLKQNSVEQLKAHSAGQRSRNALLTKT